MDDLRKAGVTSRPERDGVDDARLETATRTPSTARHRPGTDEGLVRLWWVCRVLISTLLGTAAFGYTGIELGEQPLLLLGGVCLVAAAGIGAALLIARRREKVGRSPDVAMASIVVAYLAAVLLLRGLDLVIVLGGIATFVAVAYLLHRRWAPALIASGVLVAGAIADRSMLLPEQYDIGYEPTGVAILAMVFLVQLLALAFVVIRTARDTSIRRRLLMTFTSVTLLPGVVIAGTSFIFGYRSSKIRRFGELDLAVSTRVSRITDWAADLGDDLGVLRVLYSPMLQGVALAEPGSEEFDDSYGAALAQLTDVVWVHGRFDVLLFYDVDGQLVLSTKPQDRAPDLGDPAALEAGLVSTYVGPFVQSGVLDEPALTVAAPVLGETGTPLGILVGQATARDLRWIVAVSAGVAEDIETYVVDGEGRLMTKLADPADDRQIARSAGIGAMLRSGGRVEEMGTNYTGTRVLGVYQWLPQMDLGIVSEVDAASLSEATQGTMYGIVGISLASSAIAVFVSTTITGSITGPLAEVAEVSARIAEGYFDTEVTVESDDELGQLSSSVNRMSVRLRQLVGGLEERVAARTADLARRSAQLETAAQVAREAASIRDTDELLQVAVNQIAEQFGFYHVGLHLVNAAGRSAVLRAASPGGGDTLLAQGLTIDLDGMGIIAATARTGRPNIVRDVDQDERYLSLPELPDTRSELSLPLRIRDEVIGVLDVQSTAAGYFTHEDVTYLQTMADQVALALENAALLEEAEDRLQEIERLVAAEQQTGWQRLVASRPNWAYVYDGLTARPVSETTLRVDEPDLVLPLGDAERRFGEVKVQRHAATEITGEQTALARAIADETSRALERARLFRDTQDTLIEVGTSYTTSRAIIETRSPEGVLQAIADHVATPDLDRVVLLTLASSSATGQDSVTATAMVDRSEPGSDVLGTVWAMTAFPTLAGAGSDGIVLAADEGGGRPLLGALDLRSALVLPLSVGPRRVGWLAIGSTEQDHDFTDREVRLYGGLVDLSAAVIRNFQLLDLAEGRAERAQALSAISGSMRETLDMDLILQTALREIGENLGVSNIEVRMRGTRREAG